MEQRRALVARLILGRLSLREMKVEVERQLGITVGLTTLHKDSNIIESRWREEQVPEDMERWRTQQNMSLDALERHCIKQQMQDGAKIADRILAIAGPYIDDAKAMDRIRREIWKLVPNGPEWVTAHLRLHERRARLNGTDRPQKIELGAIPDMVDETPADMAEAMNVLTVGRVVESVPAGGNGTALPSGGNGTGGTGGNGEG